METRTFRTNLTCKSCVEKVTPFLDADPDILNWKVDISKAEKPLTVTGHFVDAKRIRDVVKKGGFDVFEEISSASSAAASVPTRVQQSVEEPEKSFKTYFPLILIFGYLLSVILVVAWKTDSFSMPVLMNWFMGGFFLVFSFFKLINLKGFAESYQSYDILAKRSVTYSYAYPFIELTLGFAYITQFAPLFTNLSTAIVMALSSVGVVQSVTRKRKIKCACLGTMFNLPMSTITLIEDLLMFVMALTMTALLIRDGVGAMH